MKKIFINSNENGDASVSSASLEAFSLDTGNFKMLFIGSTVMGGSFLAAFYGFVSSITRWEKRRLTRSEYRTRFFMSISASRIIICGRVFQTKSVFLWKIQTSKGYMTSEESSQNVSIAYTGIWCMKRTRI